LTLLLLGQELCTLEQGGREIEFILIDFCMFIVIFRIH